MYALYKSSTSNNQMFHVKHFEKNKKWLSYRHDGEKEVKNMSFAKKYNKGNVIFDIDIADFSFMKLSDIYTSYGKNVIKVDGLYINKKGIYKPHPVVINVEEKTLIDLPEHMTETVEEILKDGESISLIKRGCVGLRATKYTDKKYNKTCYSVEWVDM